jgi:hypothetical protein
MTTRFKILPVDPESPEFEEVIAGQIDSFNKPYQSLFRLYYPIFGHESEEEKKVAFKNLVELERQWARDDPIAAGSGPLIRSRTTNLQPALSSRSARTTLLVRTKAKRTNLPFGIPRGDRESISTRRRAF